jgi:hypothetical protein
MDMAVLSLSSSLSPDLGDNVAGCGVAPVIDHPAKKAATVRLRSDWPRLRSGILTEMFFQVRAENFGPLAERVFHCVGDDGCGADNAGRGSRCSHVLGRSRACLVGLSQSRQQCPLLGAKRTSISGGWRSAFSQEPTFASCYWSSIWWFIRIGSSRRYRWLVLE